MLEYISQSVHDTKNFYKPIWRSFQIDEEWCLFYCDDTLGCQVIQDFDLSKLVDLQRHNVFR